VQKVQQFKLEISFLSGRQ